MTSSRNNTKDSRLYQGPEHVNNRTFMLGEADLIVRDYFYIRSHFLMRSSRTYTHFLEPRNKSGRG